MTVPCVNGLLYRRRITGTPRRSAPRVGQVRAPRHDLTKDQELEVIKSGTIRCRPADIHDTSMQIIDSTAIVLTTLDSTPWPAGTTPFVARGSTYSPAAHGSSRRCPSRAPHHCLGRSAELRGKAMLQSRRRVPFRAP